MRIYEKWSESLIAQRLLEITDDLGNFPNQSWLKSEQPRLFHAIYRLGFTMGHFHQSIGTLRDSYSGGILFPELTKNQLSVLTGSLLGDGSLIGNKNFPNRNWHFKTSQSKFDFRGEDKISYMNWLCGMLSPHSKSKIYEGETKSKFICKHHKKTPSSHYYSIRTCSSLEISKLSRKWYKNIDGNFERNDRDQVIKIVPNDINLDALSLAIWYMDDGSHAPNHRRCDLHTMNFTSNEVDLLCERLWNNLSISSYPYLTDDGIKIIIKSKSYEDFIDIVQSQIMWSCFKYKTDMSNRKILKGKAFGSRIANSKLNDEIVKEIKFLCSDKKTSHKHISEQFGVSESTIWCVANNKTWKHVL